MHAMTLQGTSTTALHRGHAFLRCIVLLSSPCSLPTPLPCEGRHGFWPLSQGQGHHRTPSTFRQELSRIKDRDPALRTFGVVYEIPCSCGKKYRGETKRVLETQLKEHQAATRRGETEKSAIAEHACSRQHQALWGETRILDHASHHTALLIKEAKHISLRDPVELFNRNQGLDIDYCWKHLVKGTRRQQQTTVELDLGDVICFMMSPDTSLTNQCSYDTLVRSPVVLLSVYSDAGQNVSKVLL